ncbi:hypothetical protein BH23GEM9_BH23GEM9_09040 [soil metagenome]
MKMPRVQRTLCHVAAVLALALGATAPLTAAAPLTAVASLPAPAGQPLDVANPRGEGAARADTTDIDRLLWAASTLQHVLGERDYSTALLLGLASREWPAGMDAASEIGVFVERARSRAGEFDPCRTADAVEGTLCTLERMHTFVPASLASALADEASRLVAQALRTPAPPLAAMTSLAFQRQDAVQQYLVQRMDRLWPGALAAAGTALPLGPGVTGHAAVLALEPWLRDRTGHGLADGAAAVIAANPALGSLLNAWPLLGDIRAGRLQPASVQEVVGRYNAFFSALVDSAHTAVRAFGALGDGAALAALGDRAAAALGVPPQPGDLAGWAARRSLVFLASRSAAHAGADGLPASLSALGNAAVDMHRGLGDLPGSLLNLGRNVAALALTGNVLGIASTMTSLLNVAGVGHATSAQDVRALRGVMDSLRMQVDGRFDRLDVAVDSVLVSLSGGFERLERAMALTGEASRREIAAVHADVVALNARFDRLEANLQAYLEAGFDRDHARTLSRCLEHRQRFAPPHDAMDFATFSGCLVDFRTRGAADARDALLADRTTPATDDAAIVAALADTSRHNFARRLPLIARAAAARHGHSAAPGTLVNAVEWAVAAEAYVRMLDDWPALAPAVTTADLDALIAAGQEIEAWSRRLTTDAAGRPRADLFDAVLRDYARGTAELRDVVEFFAQGQQERRLQRIPRDSLVREMVAADGQGRALDVPRGLVDRLPTDALAAGMLGLHPLELRYHVVLNDSIVRDNFRRPFLRGTRHDRHHYVRPTLVVEAFAGGIVVRTFEASGTPIRHRTDEMAGGADSERVRSTRVLEQDPAARFIATDWPSLSRDGDWAARPAADGALAPLRSGVEVELERFAAQTLDDLFGAVCTGREPPAGATAEVDRIRQALATMTTARTLFNAYARAGMSRTAAFDPALADLIAGDGRLVDQVTLCGRLQRGDRMLRVLWLDDEPARAAARASAFVLTRFADAASLPEPLDLAAATLERLRAARRIQATRTASGS